ncbi:PA0069 family radical SAM protein [Dyella acidiphila]|uniref:PA0069 family radical SAM protein n=1 Tax=Dyella acidiphila TaxID=2775866 RepID=UPI001CE3BE90|nr:PA0069 family radical SAM protein [Dyella acidiphila]
MNTLEVRIKGGCIYCFARPSHSYLNLSPGLDFETKLRAKTNLAEVLRADLAKPTYVIQPINIGSNTDPYQPIEKRWRLTRAALEVLAECHHPCTIVTKNALVERDLDLLVPMARERLVQVLISVNSLDNQLAAKLEPRASAPHRRIKAIRTLAEAGVPVGVLVAPIIPALNDRDMEAVLEQAADAGASCAGYTVLRLPYELKALFREWLQHHAPQRAAHVMSLVQQMNNGRDYDSNFATRMRGQGVFADLLRKRFEIASRRHNFSWARTLQLDTSRFVPPRKPSPQGELF